MKPTATCRAYKEITTQQLRSFCETARLGHLVNIWRTCERKSAVSQMFLWINVDKSLQGRMEHLTCRDSNKPWPSLSRSPTPSDARWRVTKFLALTGWRRGEVLGLKWTEIDLTTRTARLADTKTGFSMRPLPH